MSPKLKSRNLSKFTWIVSLTMFTADQPHLYHPDLCAGRPYRLGQQAPPPRHDHVHSLCWEHCYERSPYRRTIPPQRESGIQDILRLFHSGCCVLSCNRNSAKCRSKWIHQGLLLSPFLAFAAYDDCLYSAGVSQHDSFCRRCCIDV